MKIAITGAHRVGKTTLVEILQETLAGYEFRMEPYYELEEAGYEFAESPNVDDYLEQLEYSAKQISSSDDNVIFDRCPVDLLAYIQAIDETINIRTLYNKVERFISKIDLLVFIPIEEPDLIICQDFDLPELRNRVNEILKESVWTFGIETIEVNGSLLNRRDQVISRITS
ncbi:MAG: ATP-binding protein [Bacteroidales bacterium]|nr:ATP-binding protein [Bacteroidales bacterium]